jgi:hypothetical protein
MAFINCEESTFDNVTLIKAKIDLSNLGPTFVRKLLK